MGKEVNLPKVTLGASGAWHRTPWGLILEIHTLAPALSRFTNEGSICLEVTRSLKCLTMGPKADLDSGWSVVLHANSTKPCLLWCPCIQSCSKTVIASQNEL